MTQENKELLLKDLCSRLPYRAFVQTYRCNTGSFELLMPRLLEAFIKDEGLEIKPYLRPMSSITEEEDEWLNDRMNFSRDDEADRVRQKWGIVMQEIYTNSSKYVFSNFTEILDWLNAHHFDYRGLIPMGLALEAKEGMYNLN